MDYLNTMLYLAISAVALHFLLSLMSNKKKKLPPGPPGVPFFGNLFGIGSLPHAKFAELCKTHGPLLRIQLGQLLTVVLSSPAVAEEALKNDSFVSNRPINDAVCSLNHHEKAVGFLPVGPNWRAQRKICNTQIFSASKMEATQCIRRKVIRDLLSYVEKCSEKGEAVDIWLAAFTTSLNLLSNTVFSVDLCATTELAVEFRNITHNLVIELGSHNLADFFPFLKMIDPQGIKRRSKVLVKKLLDLFETLIKERVDGKRPPGTKQGDDVLDGLLDIVRESHDFDRAILQDLFAGGTDTTPTTVEWIMAELIRNPEKMRKAQTELNEVIGKGIPIEESDIGRLPYLQAIVKEGFRLHPAIPLSVPRQTVSDVDILGYTVPKGTQVLTNSWAMGRDPNLWENPLSFEPERFMGSEVDFKGNHFQLIPFGAGRRICPGLPLASRMIPMILATFIHGFQWKLDGGISPDNLNMDEKFGITLEKLHHLKVLVNAWAIGRDPDTWKNAESFEPERFLGTKIDVKGRDFELIPFGAGRRICPGLPLAIRMLHLMLGSLLHGFDWKLEGGLSPEKMNMEEKFGLTSEKLERLHAIPIPLPK